MSSNNVTSIAVETAKLNDEEKSNRLVACEINKSLRTVTWTIGHFAPITVWLERMHNDNVAYAALHGVKQRGGDGAAIEKRDPETGKLRSLEEMLRLKYDGVKEIAEHLNSGSADWRLAGAARTGGTSARALLVQCMMELKSWTHEQAVKWVDDGKKQKEWVALLSNAKIKPTADRITAMQTAHIDVDAMLDDVL